MKKIIIAVIVFVSIYIALQLILARGFELGESGDLNTYMQKFSCQKDSDCEHRANFTYCNNSNYNGRIKLTPWKDLPINHSTVCGCFLHHCFKK